MPRPENSTVYEVNNPDELYTNGYEYTDLNGTMFVPEESQSDKNAFLQILREINERYPEYSYLTEEFSYTDKRFRMYSNTMSALSHLMPELYDPQKQTNKDVKNNILGDYERTFEKFGFDFDRNKDVEKKVTGFMEKDPDRFSKYVFELTSKASKLARTRSIRPYDYDPEQSVLASAVAMDGVSHMLGLQQLTPEIESIKVYSDSKVVKSGIGIKNRAQKKMSKEDIEYLDKKLPSGKHPTDNPKTMKNISDMSVMFFLSGRSSVYVGDLAYDIDPADGSVAYKFDDYRNPADFSFNDGEQMPSTELNDLTFISSELAQRIVSVKPEDYGSMLFESGIKGSALPQAVNRFSALQQKIRNNEIELVSDWNSKYAQASVMELANRKPAQPDPNNPKDLRSPSLFGSLYNVTEAVSMNRLGQPLRAKKTDVREIPGLVNFSSDPAKSDLFGTDYRLLRWGITPGEHVTHIAGQGDVVIDAEKNYTDYHEVSQQAAYNSLGDTANANVFMNIAREASSDYKEPFANNEFKNVLFKIKDYLIANTRSGQQKAITEMRLSMLEYREKLMKQLDEYVTRSDKGETTEDDRAENEMNIKRRDALDKYAAAFQIMQDGSLEHIRSEEEKREKISEPADVGIGHIGIWTKTEDVLFPHEPSPNDIKQGIGVQDCFMLSAMVQIAAKNPKMIKDAMRDNNDGTVTVRFFNKHDGNKPVYMTVNKTVNKVAGANAYSSSSLWVQMLEKAYVKYVNTIEAPLEQDPKRRQKLEGGFSAIDRSNTYEFMNAFSQEKYTGVLNAFGSGYGPTEYIYAMDANGEMPNHPNGYLPCEESVYKFFDKRVNKGSEVLTVGIGTMNKRKIEFAKSHGIRTGHAYTVMGVFESEVDGKIKKFVQLRDPYATFKSRYDDSGKLVDASKEISATINAGMDSMGTFNLELTDFQKMFTSVTGMTEDAKKEFIREQGTWRNYDDNPLTPKEFEECRFKEARSDERILPDYISTDPFVRQLNSVGGFKEILNQVKDLATDLASTDEWFVWSNTGKFNNMRDSVYDLAKTMESLKGKQMSRDDIEGLIDKFRDAEQKADLYADAKLRDIKNKEGETPKLRSVHRLTDALSLKMICQGKGPLPVGKKVFTERVNIIAADMCERYDRMIENKPIENHPDVTAEQLGEASKLLLKYVKANKDALNSHAILDTVAIGKVRKHIREMNENGGIKPVENVQEDKKLDLGDSMTNDF